MGPDDGAAASEQPPDDLTAITHVGPETARRLHDAGVRTFAELAGHTPGELGAIARVAVQRVEQWDWVGQASRLAGAPSPAGPDEPDGTGDNGEHPESFVLRLTLDDSGKVIRTVVQHAASQHEAPPWVGWDTDRLLDFLSSYVDLADAARPAAAGARATPTPQREPARPPTAPPPGEPTPTRPASPLPAEVRLQSLEVLSATGVPQRSFAAGEAFAVRLVLRLAAAAPPGAAPVGCTVTVHATTLGAVRRQDIAVGVAETTMGAFGDATVELRSDGLPAGIYRLEGVVRLRGPAPGPPRLAPIDGGLVEIGGG